MKEPDIVEIGRVAHPCTTTFSWNFDQAQLARPPK